MESEQGDFYRYGRFAACLSPPQRRTEREERLKRELLKEVGVGAIWCVALEKSPNVPRVQELLKNAGLAAAADFYLVRKPRPSEFQTQRARETGVPHEEGDSSTLPLSGYGCHCSHRRLAREMEQRGLSTALVMEEDVVFRPEYVDGSPTALSLWKNLFAELQVQKIQRPEIQVCLLGCFPIWAPAIAPGRFPRMRGLGLHAYVLFPEGARAFANLSYFGCFKELHPAVASAAKGAGGGIDFWMAEKMHCVSCRPMIARQKGGHSSQSSFRKQSLIGKLANWTMDSHVYKNTFFVPRAMEHVAYFGWIWVSVLVLFVLCRLAARTQRPRRASIRS